MRNRNQRIRKIQAQRSLGHIYLQHFNRYVHEDTLKQKNQGKSDRDVLREHQRQAYEAMAYARSQFDTPAIAQQAEREAHSIVLRRMS